MTKTHGRKGDQLQAASEAEWMTSTGNAGAYPNPDHDLERDERAARKHGELGDRLDLAELCFRATNDPQFYSAMKDARRDYQNCLRLVEIDTQRKLIESKPFKQKITAAVVVKLKERADAAAAHQAEVSKTPYLECPQREIVNAPVRARLAQFKYEHIRDIYNVQRAERHQRELDKMPPTDRATYIETGETKLIDGERVPVVRKLKAIK